MRGCLTLFAAVAMSGCASSNATLQVDSGPPDKSGGAGVPTYAVHVGERVKIDFAPVLGAADYAVCQVEAAGTWEDCGPPIQRRFAWTHDFGGRATPGTTTRLIVTAYSQQGRRDRMPVGGTMMEERPIGEAADLRIAQATAKVQFYQSHVEIKVKMAEGSPDWGLTKLVLKKEDGTTARIHQVSGSSSGFRVSGPDAGGAYLVGYDPRWDEVNRRGDTEARLTVADERGRTTEFCERIVTP